jgi:hypothetical protein
MGPFSVEVHSDYQTMEDVSPYTEHQVDSTILQCQKFDEVILLLCLMCIHMPPYTSACTCELELQQETHSCKW